MKLVSLLVEISENILEGRAAVVFADYQGNDADMRRKLPGLQAASFNISFFQNIFDKGS